MDEVDPCRGAEYVPYGLADHRDSVAVHLVIDVPVVLVVQPPGGILACRKLWFPQLQFLSRRSHARCCARQVLEVSQVQFLRGVDVAVVPQRQVPAVGLDSWDEG